MLELLETQGFHALDSFVYKVGTEINDKRSYSTITKEPEYIELLEILEKEPIEHPKVKLLKKTIREQLQLKPDSRMLVFSQYRNTASFIVEELNKIPGVETGKFVGQSSKIEDQGMTQEEQSEKIRQLKNGALNVLVATSVAEEGLDIPEVDQVIFYEPIPSGIRHIQRRGRTGRKTPGKVTILVTRGTLDTAYLQSGRRKMEKMKEIVVQAKKRLEKRSKTRETPPVNRLTEEEIEALEITRETGNDTGLITLVEEMEDLEKDREWLGYDSSVQWAPRKETGTLSVTVEKIQKGSAIVNVEGLGKAILTPEDYSGPRNLIKKDTKFRASANVHLQNGVSYITINEVLEILESEPKKSSILQAFKPMSG
jgi:superfamily II DNA/RNA helicase